MKKSLLFLLISIFLFSVAFADDVMWVDGNGNIISQPGGEVIDTITTDESTSNAPAYDGTGVEDENGNPRPTEDPNAPKKWEYTPTTLKATYQGQEYEVLELGTRITTLKVGRQTLHVRTSELTFNTKAAAGKQLAIINTPKTGRASMFKRASGKSAIIYKCQTGRIVSVEETKKRFAKVHYADADGYVASKSIQYLEPWTDEIEIAYIAYKGNVKSRETVKVRQKASSASRILDEFKCGKLVVVLDRQPEWTQIEVGNLRCFILTRFLTESEVWTGETLENGLTSLAPAAPKKKTQATGTDLNGEEASATDIQDVNDIHYNGVSEEYIDDEGVEIGELPEVIDEPATQPVSDDLQIDW